MPRGMHQHKREKCPIKRQWGVRESGRIGDGQEGETKYKNIVFVCVFEDFLFFFFSCTSIKPKRR